MHVAERHLEAANWVNQSNWALALGNGLLLSALRSLVVQASVIGPIGIVE